MSAEPKKETYPCYHCGRPLPDDYVPESCCSGRDCGCMGMPTNPPFHNECWEQHLGRAKE